MKGNIIKVTALGMLAALSVVLVYFIHTPILPDVTFLEYDPADVPILIAGYIFGPASGLLLTLAVSIVQGVTVSAGSGPTGIFMHFIATGCFVTVAGFIYKALKRNLRALIISLAAGAAAMTLVMIPLNLVIIPLFTKQDFGTVLNMIIPVIIPFNLIKASVNGIAAGIIFKAIPPRAYSGLTATRR